MTSATNQRRAQELLAPLLSEPGHAAVLCDVDGTLAPIVERPEDAAVPDRTRDLLAKIAARFALVACVSGRRAADARTIVGLDAIDYVGNHGLELLRAGASEVESAPGVHELGERVATFAREAYTPTLRDLGIRLEDKREIWSLHWREAGDETRAKEALELVARDAAAAGLVPHWGRKVLELRPPVDIDKGSAIAALIAGDGIDAALYAGDDTTDLDAFRALRQLRERGAIRHAVCIGVASPEAPAPILEQADLVAPDPSGVADLLALLTA